MAAGVSVQTDIAELKKAVPHIVVGTPGRVLDLAVNKKVYI
jgi:superfamily II DNA/RNA helicase